MRNIVIAVLVGLSVSAVFAEDFTSPNLPLTGLNKRVEGISQRLRNVEDKATYIQAREVGQLQARVIELERKVSGMQDQITVLHAKKVDKQYSK